MEASGGLNDEFSSIVLGVVMVRRLVWLLVTVALLVSVGVFGPAWAEPGGGPDVVDEVVERADWVSASVTARALGVRVEVVSQRSETGRVWVHPDGSVEEEQAAAPVRFVDGSGGWREIDTDLRRSGGVVDAA